MSRPDAKAENDAEQEIIRRHPVTLYECVVCKTKLATHYHGGGFTRRCRKCKGLSNFVLQFYLGSKIVVLSCEHVDVKAGTVGVVTDILDGGYGVEVEGEFLIPGANQRREKQKNVVFAALNEVKKYDRKS